MRPFLYAAVAALLASGAVAYADPVTYTLTGTFTGTLNGQAFSDAAGTFTYVSDTAYTQEVVPDYYYTNAGGVATVTIAGFATATLSSSLEADSVSDGGVGFIDPNSGFSVGLEDPATPLYMLSVPFADTGSLTEGGLFGDSPESTSAGELDLTDGDFVFGDTTFTAVGAAATTPEPSSFLLLGTGLIGAIGAARRRLLSVQQ